MKHLNSKISIKSTACAIVLCFLLVGCVDSSFRLEQAIKDAIAQAEDGNASAAINKLESLQSKHPDNADVAEALGIAYEQRGNFLLASNYYQKATRLSPEKQHLKLQSARNLISASRKDDAVTRMEEYLDVFPEDGEAWLQLGRLQNELNEEEGAIDSLTRGILLSAPENHRSDDHQILGFLYLGISDYPQADYYLNQSLTLAEDPDSEAKALQGLIQSSVSQLDWDVARVFLNRLEASHSDVFSAAKTQGFLEEVETALLSRKGIKKNKKTAPPVVEEAVTEAVVEEAVTEAVAEEAVTEAVAEETVTEAVAEEAVTEPVAEEAVTEAVAEEAVTEPVVEEAVTEAVVEEAVTEAVVEEAVTEAVVEEAVTETVAEEAVTEAVAEEAVAEAVAEEAVAEPVVEEDEATVTGVETPVDTDEGADSLEDGAVDPEIEAEVLEEPYVAPENQADLLILRSKQLIEEGSYADAIRTAWEAVNLKSESPASWFMLSYAYSRFGQDLNAESAALEALRLNPNNKKIVMHYLKILQRSRSALRFHDELLNAYQRFNKDPDFVLALARSYARIKNDPENAAALYRRFLDLEPDNERAAKVREEISFVE